IGEFPIGFLKGFNRFLLENSRVYISFRGNFVWENPYWKSPISYLNSSPFPHEKRYGSCTNFPTCRIGSSWKSMWIPFKFFAGLFFNK
ncbi:hypothetical protein Avbf_17667, partial [Armadillidium vulgare]